MTPVVPFALLFLSNFLFGSNSKQIAARTERNSFAHETKNATLLEAEKIHTRSLLEVADIRFTSLSMALCETKEDCTEVGVHMICNHGRCDCKIEYVLVERVKFGCYPKAQIFAPCEVSEQCTGMNRNTYCNPSSRCTCSLNYYFDGRECSVRYDSNNLKAQEVYKAAVVAAACFIVAVVGIFVACIVRRSFCRREQHLQQSDSTRTSDIFSISDEIAALRAVDKPPSYEEVLQIERTFYGIPPPEYTASSRGNPPVAPTMPTTCSLVQTRSINQSFMQDSSVVSGSTCTLSINDSTTVDLTKNSEYANITSEGMSQNSDLLPQEPTTIITEAANFLATVEVLAPPTDVNVVLPSTPKINENSFQSTSLTNYSSSMPPSRPLQPHFVPTHNSSSLPCSPYLNSHSKFVSPFKLRDELLKQNLHSSGVPSPSHSLPESLLSSLQADVLHHPTVPDDVEIREPGSAVAYDNPGFVSDSQDLCNAV